MDDKNFSQLLSATFDNGTVHFKHLEKFLKCLILKLNLTDVTPHEKFQYSSKNDALLGSIPSTNTLKQGLCTKDESNPFENMINVVNLTKRVEALEISVQKLTSMMQTILSERQREESIDSDESMNENVLISKVSDTQMPNGQNEIKSNQNLIENSNQKKCCGKYLSSSETFGVTHENSIKDLPRTQTLPQCPFIRLEKNCKKKSKEIQLEDKFANLCDLRELERHLKRQNDATFSIINSNHFYLLEKICSIEKQMGRVEGQIDDIFFACEQNDEKIDDTILSMSEFNAKIFSLKSDVKGLLDDSRQFKENIFALNEKYETMNIVKANKSHVDEQLKLYLDILFDEIKNTVNVKDFEHFVDGIRMRLSVVEENSKKLQADVKKSMICFMASLEEKLGKEELKRFKNLVGNLFDDFIKDLRILLFNISQNALSMGASKCLQTNLNCIACDSKVSMSTEFPQLQNSSRKFKNKIFRVKTAKKSLKSDIQCAGMKSFFKYNEKKKKLSQCHQSTPQFPPPSQQCFIISKDNTILRADPLKCLIDSKYRKI